MASGKQSWVAPAEPVAGTVAHGARGTFRRARCIGCRTFAELCYCAEIPTLSLRTKIVIVMHKFEQWKTTNTGWLAARATKGQVFVRGEDQAAPLLSNAAVLYPSEHAVVLTPEMPFTTLVVPDGTWSQVRRIVRREDSIAKLPHVKLASPPQSQYKLRRGAREGGVATLEAVAHAIAAIEGEAAAAPLHAIFKVMVERTLRSRGLPPGA